jgi:uncharacterized SAM-binding protein YcdF (DUF218 family)
MADQSDENFKLDGHGQLKGARSGANEPVSNDWSVLKIPLSSLHKPGLVHQFLVIVLLSAGMALWLGRVTVLQSAANLWIVSDPVVSADAAVVLGGGSPEVRPFVAASLYQQGLVGKVLLSRVADDNNSTVGGLPRDTEFNRNILSKLGVPPTAIELFGTENKNTADEAFSLKQWAMRSKPSVLLIPIEIFSARRVQWIFRHEFFGMAIKIETPSFEPQSYTRGTWWTTPHGRNAFGSELMKYAYYRLRY